MSVRSSFALSRARLSEDGLHDRFRGRAEHTRGSAALLGDVPELRPLRLLDGVDGLLPGLGHLQLERHGDRAAASRDVAEGGAGTRWLRS